MLYQPPDARERDNLTAHEDTPDERFVSLLTGHQEALLAFAISLAPEFSDAEDLVQRANLVLWRKRETFRMETNFRAWAFKIVRLEAKSLWSDRKRKNWLIYDDELSSLVGDRLASQPAEYLSARADALRRCLEKLSVFHRSLVLDRYQRGLTVAECAEKANRSEGGLRVTLHRLRGRLQKCVSQISGREAAS